MVELVSGGSDINGATPSSFYKFYGIVKRSYFASMTVNVDSGSQNFLLM